MKKFLFTLICLTSLLNADSSYDRKRDDIRRDERLRQQRRDDIRRYQRLMEERNAAQRRLENRQDEEKMQQRRQETQKEEEKMQEQRIENAKLPPPTHAEPATAAAAPQFATPKTSADGMPQTQPSAVSN